MKTYLRWCSAIAVGLVASACKPAADQPAEKAPPPSAHAETAAELAASGPPLAAGWQRIEIAKVSGDPAEKLATAQGAMKALGTKLTQTMAEAIGKGDLSAGITACQQAAPTVAKTISKKFDVEVGRTSFKVRNSSNQPRAWAQPIVDARYDKPIFMKGPQGQHAFIAPIRLAEPCVNCHGTEAQISEPVKSAISQRYPNDEATGFAPGDLRGWFWVEFAADGG